jgi:nitrile hydratase
MSYYEKWFTGMVELIVARGLATREEVESGKPARGSAKSTPPFTADKVAAANRRASMRRAVGVVPQFRVGQPTRARSINPTGHTRLPRYARGKLGAIVRDHGVFVFPDTNAHFLGENPQHLYSVRFTARELWGDQASPRDTIYLDLWDDYLEHV